MKKGNPMILSLRETGLFFMITFISGVGWVFIPSQIVSVEPLFSISYRFLVAGGLIFCFCFWKGERFFDRSVFHLIIAQGAFMFPANYFLTYTACKYVPSGLVGLISSMTLVPAYCFGVLTKSHSFDRGVVFWILGSVLGLLLIFEKDLIFSSYKTLGLLFAVFSTFSTALGLTLVPHIKQKTSLSIFAITSISMLTGSFVCFLLGVISSGAPEISLEISYLLNLSILSLLTPVVFVSFYYFSSQYGAYVASYVWVLAPVFSVMMSIFIEGYRPTGLETLGILIICVSGLFLNRKIQAKFESKGESL